MPCLSFNLDPVTGEDSCGGGSSRGPYTKDSGAAFNVDLGRVGVKVCKPIIPRCCSMWTGLRVLVNMLMGRNI